MKFLTTNTKRAIQLLRYGLIDPVEYYVHEGYRTVYIETAKVACTSIKLALFSEPGAKVCGGQNIHETANQCRVHYLASKYDAFFRFTFVRNPFDRLVSCFEDKVECNANTESAQYLRSKWDRMLFRWRGHVDLFKGDLSFDEFASAVCAIPDTLADRHFRSQSSIIDATHPLEIHFIGRFEKMSEDWQRLREHVPLPALPHTNVSERAPWVEYFRRRDTVQAVARRYRSDIALFNYHYIYEKLLSSSR